MFEILLNQTTPLHLTTHKARFSLAFLKQSTLTPRHSVHIKIFTSWMANLRTSFALSLSIEGAHCQRLPPAIFAGSQRTKHS